MHALYDQQTASVVTTWGSIPPQIIWPDGSATHGAALGHVHADRWSIIEAVYVDAGQPSPHHTEASRSSAYANGRIEITRSWQAPVDLAPIKAAKIAAARAEQDKRLAAYIVTVPVNGVQQPFGCDPVSRENILGICGLIAQETGGLLPPGAVPNPRGFTPKGQSFPINVTHAEFALIGAFMAAAKDIHFVAYAAHKAAINALTTAEAVASYDITAGWPA